MRWFKYFSLLWTRSSKEFIRICESRISHIFSSSVVRLKKERALDNCNVQKENKKDKRSAKVSGVLEKAGYFFYVRCIAVEAYFVLLQSRL